MSDESSAEKIVRELWDEHSTCRAGGQLGIGMPFQAFYCTTCHTPYPCSVAQKVAQWGQIERHDFLSVRAPVRGETVSENGRGASLDASSWAIGEADLWDDDAGRWFHYGGSVTCRGDA